MKYQLFGNSGLRVSELCLGTMTFGQEWGTGADKDESKKIFDTFANAGGNFLDTANRYTEGTSERFLGEFIADNRDYFVVASKYTLYDHRNDPNASGNHRKNMIRSVEQSLKRLNTDYLDVLWLHMWDGTTPLEEILRAFDDLVSSGKILYTGISDVPAWVVASANTMAILRNQAAFIGLQIEYSLLQRTPERDLLPMAKHFGMAITPWSPLGAGLLSGKYNDSVQGKGRLTEKSLKMTEKNLQIARKVSEIAAQKNCTPTQIALAWLRQRNQQIIPIIGARTAVQLEDSLGCLNVILTKNEINELDLISQIELGFPHDFLKMPTVKDVCFADNKDKIVFKN
jgi:aryl-alcohol dehydrogenase-like predicted oxidoreductase